MAAERDIDDLPRNDANHTALTPLWFLERAALAQPDRASLVHGPVRYTWADTYRRCRRLASALARRSVGHGSTVNFLSPVPSSFPRWVLSPGSCFRKSSFPLGQHERADCAQAS
jgi:acyl-CoA synthetase (AMP-forming)/AMP-acid ligase II